MTKPSYIVLTLDLATARNAVDVTGGPGFVYSSVTVLAVPAGANVTVAFGNNNAFLPLGIAGQNFMFEDDAGCPLACDEGLFITHPAGAGQLVLLIGTGSNRIGGQ